MKLVKNLVVLNQIMKETKPIHQEVRSLIDFLLLGLQSHLILHHEGKFCHISDIQLDLQKGLLYIPFITYDKLEDCEAYKKLQERLTKQGYNFIPHNCKENKYILATSDDFCHYTLNVHDLDVLYVNFGDIDSPVLRFNIHFEDFAPKQQNMVKSILTLLNYYKITFYDSSSTDNYHLQLDPKAYSKYKLKIYDGYIDEPSLPYKPISKERLLEHNLPTECILSGTPHARQLFFNLKLLSDLHNKVYYEEIDRGLLDRFYNKDLVYIKYRQSPTSIPFVINSKYYKYCK